MSPVDKPPSVVSLVADMWRAPLGGQVDRMCQKAPFSGGAGRAPRQLKVSVVLWGDWDWVGKPGYRNNLSEAEQRPVTDVYVVIECTPLERFVKNKLTKLGLTIASLASGLTAGVASLRIG